MYFRARDMSHNICCHKTAASLHCNTFWCSTQISAVPPGVQNIQLRICDIQCCELFYTACMTCPRPEVCHYVTTQMEPLKPFSRDLFPNSLFRHLLSKWEKKLQFYQDAFSTILTGCSRCFSLSRSAPDLCEPGQTEAGRQLRSGGFLSRYKRCGQGISVTS